MKIFSNKLLCLCLSCIMMVSMAGCAASSSTSNPASAPQSAGGSAPGAEEITLTCWTKFPDPQSTDGNSVAFYNAIAKLKEAYPNITIEHTGMADESFKTKVKTAAAAGELPDIFFAAGGEVSRPLISSALPIDEYVQDGTLDRVLPGTTDPFTYDGKLYGLPFNLWVTCLYCNEELFNQCNVEIPKTYADLLSAIAAFNENGIVPIALGEKERWPGAYFAQAFAMRAAGGEAANKFALMQEPFDTPEMLIGAEKLKEFVDAGAFNNGFLGISYDDSKAMFLQGKAAMFWMGSWVVGEIDAEGSAVKDKVTVVNFPAIQEGKGDTTEFLGSVGGTFMVNKDTQHKEQALQVIKFLCESMSGDQMSAGAGLPTWKHEDPGNADVSPLMLKVSEMTQDSTIYVEAWDNTMDGNATEEMKNIVAEVLAGKLTPQEYVQAMQEIQK